MKRLLFFSLCIVLFNAIYSQAAFNQFTCTLSNPNAQFVNRSSFIIDNNGDKWTGFKRLNTSSRSLVKFDGTNWTDYTASINAPVLSLACDAAGNIWVGTVNAGLIKFDGTNTTTYTRTGSGLISDTIISLAFINNKIYAGSNNGFSEFDGVTFTNYTTANSGLTNNIVTTFEKENATIWIGTANGLHDLNSGTITYKGLNTTINDIMVDQSGNKWLGTDTGLFKYDNNTFTNAANFLPIIVGGNLPTQIFSVGISINGNPLVACERNFSPDYINPTYRNNSVIEILPNNTYNFFAHSLYIFGNCLFAPAFNNEVFFVDSKIATTFTGTPFAKKFLNSFKQNVYSPAALITTITPQNTQFLDINNVSAGCNPNADIHYDGTKSLYEVPKGSGRHPIKRTALWIGGYKNGMLAMAANTARINGMDYWPGIINSSTGLADSSTATQYNKVWKLNRYDIENFKFNFLNGSIQNGSYTIPQSILDWPGNGDIFGEQLAPYFDYNSDGFYNPMYGDYPLIKGDQMLWWVYNDALSAHTETGSNIKLNIEVQVSAYAYTCPGISDNDKVLNNTTFYNYRFLNKSPDVIDSLYVAVETDGNLGNATDNYVGCDVMNQFSFYYNGDSYDEDNYGEYGYGANTPYFSCNILNGLRANIDDGLDNDKDGCTDCTFQIDPNTGNPDPFLQPILDDTLPENCFMNNFLFFSHSSDARTGDPSSAGGGIEYYRYISGRWRDGNYKTYDGMYGMSVPSPSMPNTNFVFPGNSDPYGYSIGGSYNSPVFLPMWSEQSANNLPGQRRTITSSGKTSMIPYGWWSQDMEFDFAYIFTQDSAALANGTLYQKVISDNQKVRDWFKNNNAPSCLDLTGIGIKENKNEIYLLVYPVPATNNITIDAGENNTIKALEIIDITGRKIMQLPVGKTLTQLDISSFSPGVYMVKLSTENGTAFRKFIKQ